MEKILLDKDDCTTLIQGLQCYKTELEKDPLWTASGGTVGRVLREMEERMKRLEGRLSGMIISIDSSNKPR